MDHACGYILLIFFLTRFLRSFSDHISKEVQSRAWRHYATALLHSKVILSVLLPSTGLIAASRSADTVPWYRGPFPRSLDCVY
jgi:cytochrome b561